jgi:hypothetical protein
VIDRREILSTAGNLGLLPGTVEKDYVLGWLLAGISMMSSIYSDKMYRLLSLILCGERRLVTLSSMRCLLTRKLNAAIASIAFEGRMPLTKLFHHNMRLN